MKEKRLTPEETKRWLADEKFRDAVRAALIASAAPGEMVEVLSADNWSLYLADIQHNGRVRLLERPTDVNRPRPPWKST